MLTIFYKFGDEKKRSEERLLVSVIKFLMIVAVFLLLPVPLRAGSVAVCNHYHGFDSSFSHSTSVPTLKSVYYGEACAFKFNLEFTVNTDPWQIGYDGYLSLDEQKDINQTARLKYSVEMQSCDTNTKSDHGIAGIKTFDYVDFDNIDELMQYQVSWHRRVFGLFPATCSYQNDSPKYESYIDTYLLGACGRDTGGTQYESLTDPSIYTNYKLTTRMDSDPAIYDGGGYDSYDGYVLAMDFLGREIQNGGWYEDYAFWNDNPQYVKLYDFSRYARATIDSQPESVGCVTTDEAMQYRWLRDISSVSLVDEDGALRISVSYDVPEWMMSYWKVAGDDPNIVPARLVDIFTVPIAIELDTSDTSLSGCDLSASGAVSLRKIDTDLFIIEVAFNKQSETVDVVLSATAKPDYLNFDLPVITSITHIDDTWSVATDKPTRLVVFSTPEGQDLSDISVVDCSDDVENRVDAPVRDNTLATMHQFTLQESNYLDYYVGVITKQRQSILQYLEETDIATDANGDIQGSVETDFADTDEVVDSNSLDQSDSFGSAISGNPSKSTIKILADNIAPTANAGADQEVEYGNSITLDGTGSSDSDGSIVSYEWKEGATVLSSSSSFTKSDFSVGTHTITLTVTDDDGATDTDTVVVTIDARYSSITFLDHFNDSSSWDINTANGDYAAGTEAIVSVDSPSWDTGFFANSSPANRCYYAQDTEVLKFKADDGNVSCPSDGGMTIGFWCAFDGSNLSVKPVTIHNSDFSDYIQINFGYTGTGKWTAAFKDDDDLTTVTVSTDTSSSVTSSIYIAVTVDLANSQITIYQYDNNGDSIVAPYTGAITVTGWDVTSASSLIEINYKQDADNFWMDELSLDNRVLSQAEIETRVTDMVNGNELRGSNDIPVADAGADQEVMDGETVSFDGTGSSDSDGSISSYEWKEGATVLSTSSTFDKSDFSVGTHTITLTVIDDGGAINKDEIVVNVCASSDTIAFLDHFNDTSSWDINLNNDDYAFGLRTATCINPEAYEGFFSTSTPSNNALSFVARYDNISFNAVNGNVDYTNQTSGGITVGCWLKIIGNDYLGAELFEIGNDDDYVSLWYAPGNEGIARVYFYDDGVGGYQESSTNTSSYIRNTWVYFALTVDLDSQECTLRQYDSSGTLIATDVFSVTVTGWDVKDNVYSVIKLGDYIASADRYVLDEFSIDNRVLTQTEIESRVHRMVNNYELLPNGTPVAVAGDDQGVLVGTNVTLDASGSSDADGSIASYVWKENGTTLSSASSFDKSDFAVGTHIITLTVTDDEGNSDTDDVVVRIHDKEDPLTFLAHFNDTSSWDINLDNDDYAIGSKIATLTNPITATGFFAGSSPSNNALSFDTDGDNITFDAGDGNVDYTSQTSGGITVGCWFKIVGTDYVAAKLFEIGNDNDYASVWFAPGISGRARMFFYDDGVGGRLESSTDTNSYVRNDWVYFAFTVDLDVEECCLRQFDSSGNLIAEDKYLIDVTGWDVKDNANSKIKLGGYLSDCDSYVIDEFSIENRVLSKGEIQDRVTNMVSGDERVNHNPTANAGSDQEVNDGDTVSFDGTGSSDVDGPIASYEWKEGATVLSTSSTFNKSDFAVGVHTIVLTVTDSDDLTDTDTVVITVNGAPTADAGSDQEVNDGATVSFDGTGSSDADGTIVSYEWKEGATILSTNSTFNKSDFTVGVHTIVLTVTDDDGLTDTDTVVITVNGAPTANAGADQEVNDGDTVSFDGTGSSDADGTIASYEWKEGATVLSTSSTFNKSDFTVGTHTIVLTVTDDDGLTDTDTVVITVNGAPTADAGADQEVNDGATVSFDGTGSSDADGTIASYEWKEGATVLSTSSTFNKSDFTVGVHTIVLTVTDDDGLTDTDTVVITVNGAPTADAGADQDVNDGATVSFDGTGSSDADGTIASYEWKEGATVLSTSSTFNKSDFTVGTHTIVLTVTDDDGLTDTDTIVITVNGAPTANAGSDQDVNDGDTVSFDGTGSSDADGTIASYEWKEGATVLSTSSTFNKSDFTVGTHTIVLTVTDDDGLSDTDTVVITVNGAPTADAGSDQEVNDGATVSFDGTGSSDADGTIASYEWKEGATVLSTSSTFNKSDFTVGTHTIVLTVTDDDGLTDTDTVVITVNGAPTADAGSDQEVNDGDTVSFDGTGSSDADGTIASYEWKEGATILSTNSTFNKSDFTVGVHTIVLTVTDDDGLTDTDTVVITVNGAPTADAGADQDVNDGTTVSFDGTGSSDADGTIASYEWKEGTTVLSSSATFNKSDFTVGVHTIVLTVTDDDGLTDTDTVVITVNGAPTADAGSDQEVNDGATVSFDGTGSSDADGTIASYEWKEGATVLSTSSTFNKSDFTVGVHTIVLTVTDDDGLTDTDTVVITVNGAPTADAGSDQEVNDGATVSFDGTGSSDADGTIASYEWKEGATILSTSSTFNKSDFTVGTHTIVLTVTDDDGLTDTDTVVITVNGAPTADAGADQEVNDGATVSFDGTGSSDADGTIASYEWKEGATVLSTSSTFNKSDFTVGVHTIVLTVTDDDGLTDTDTVVITVNGAPTADAGADQDVNDGATVSFDGTGSSDADGTIASYEWKEGATTLSTSSTFNKSDFTVGVHTIVLTVTDDDGLTDTDTVVITVNGAPTADAGADQEVNDGDTVSFDGTGSSDADGTIASYEWKEGATVLSTSSTFNKSDFTVGTHTIVLTVTDDDGLTDTDTVVITVNGAPTANAGADQDVNDGATVSFDGTGSSDADGTIASYEWKEGATILSTNSTFNKSDFTVGTHTIVLTVTDDDGLTDTDTVVITVNGAPTADAGADQDVNDGDTVSFDGTGSSDADGTIASYEWKEGATVLSTSSTFNKSDFAVGVHTIVLTVTDDDGLTDTDTVVITVNGAPTADAGSDQEVNDGATVSFDGTGSSDADGTIASYEWKEGATVLNSSATFNKSDFTVGVHTIVLTVTDDDGLTDTDTVVITVNGAPTADAGADQEVNDGATVSFDGTGSSDADGTIASYEWKEGATVLSTNSTFNKSDFTVGTHTIVLTVTDDDGLTDTDTIVITVNGAPTADAGADQDVNDGATVSFDGTGSSDADGTIASYEWKEGATVLSTSSTFNKSDFTVGTHTIVLTVTDDDGLTDTDTVVITVNGAPTANAGADQDVNDGATVSFDGTGSSDADGTIASYEWKEGATVLSTSSIFNKSDFTVGVHTIVLTVTDDDGLTDTDTVVITVNGAPTADAGADQEVNDGATVSFDGTGSSDADGTIASYEWKEGATVLSTSSTFNKSDFTVGTHTIVLTVTDDDGLTDTDTVVITVNGAPTADAGADQEVNDGATVSFDGTGSSDADGTIASYEWKEGATVLSSSATFNKSDFTVGVHTIVLTVTDDDGLTDTDTVVITVNGAPTADAGADQDVNDGATVSFDGTGSSDADGTIASYEWKEGATILSTSATFNKSDFAVGTHTIVLTVTDDDGLSDTDTVIIKVNANSGAPVANAGVDQDVNDGATVSFDGTGSSDADGTITSYEWKEGATILSTSSTFNKSDFTVGVHTIVLTVTDNDGLTDTDAVVITVNGAPTADAGADKEVNEGEIVSLNGSGSSDADGSIASYEWKEGATVLSTSATFNKSDFTVGTHTIVLTVTDDGGLTDADTVVITINGAPIADAGSDQEVDFGSDVVLDASQSRDNDGSIVSYEWKDGTDVISNSPSFTKDDFSVGTHTLILTVTDNDGATDVDSVLVKINGEASSSVVYSAPSVRVLSMPYGLRKNVDRKIDSIQGDDVVFDVADVNADFSSSNVSCEWREGDKLLSKDKAFVKSDFSLGKHKVTLTLHDDGPARIYVFDVDVHENTNVKLVAEAGPDKMVFEGDVVTLDATKSWVSNGEIVSYQWFEGEELLSDEAVFEIDDLSVGRHSIQLRVIDSFGMDSEDTVNILVRPIPNLAPHAYAGSDQEIFEGDTIIFYGDNSFDEDGWIVSYQWSEGDTVLCDSPNFSVSDFPVGKHTITLAVMDNDGAVAHDKLVVVVKPVPNQVPVANAGEDKKVTEGKAVTFNGDGSFDEDGTIVSYVWREGSKILSSKSIFEKNDFAVGTHEIVLTVTDNSGAISRDTLNVTVLPKQKKNSIVKSPTKQDFTLGETVAFEADSKLKDGKKPISYKWQEGKEVLSRARKFSKDNFVVGDHLITLTITSEDGTKEQENVSIKVNSNKDSVARQ